MGSPAYQQPNDKDERGTSTSGSGEPTQSTGKNKDIESEISSGQFLSFVKSRPLIFLVSAATIAAFISSVSDQKSAIWFTHSASVSVTLLNIFAVSLFLFLHGDTLNGVPRLVHQGQWRFQHV